MDNQKNKKEDPKWMKNRQEPDYNLWEKILQGVVRLFSQPAYTSPTPKDLIDKNYPLNLPPFVRWDSAPYPPFPDPIRNDTVVVTNPMQSLPPNNMDTTTQGDFSSPPPRSPYREGTTESFLWKMGLPVEKGDYEPTVKDLRLPPPPRSPYREGTTESFLWKMGLPVEKGDYEDERKVTRKERQQARRFLEKLGLPPD